MRDIVTRLFQLFFFLTFTHACSVKKCFSHKKIIISFKMTKKIDVLRTSLRTIVKNGLKLKPYHKPKSSRVDQGSESCKSKKMSKECKIQNFENIPKTKNFPKILQNSPKISQNSSETPSKLPRNTPRRVFLTFCNFIF
jgi:hypothetical protein